MAARLKQSNHGFKRAASIDATCPSAYNVIDCRGAGSGRTQAPLKGTALRMGQQVPAAWVDWTYAAPEMPAAS
jgi:hypothetical protein